jgi:hypothetical protein
MWALQQKQAYESQAMSASSRPPTLQERLDMAVKDCEARLAEAKEARDIFARNPDLERLLDIMQKGRF